MIGLGGAATLLILFVAIYCGYRCYRRCRHGHPYVTLRGRPPVDVDSVSYGSLTLESNRQDRQNRYDRQDWQDRQDRQDKGREKQKVVRSEELTWGRYRRVSLVPRPSLAAFFTAVERKKSFFPQLQKKL